jgi:hypothetical protein
MVEIKVKEEVMNDVEYDLVEDKEVLMKDFTSNYFNMEEDVTYKLSLNSTKVKPIEKVFEDRSYIKYQANVTIKEKDKVIFEGLWEMPKSVMASIFKKYEKGCVFGISKTGHNKDTKYNVIKLD